MLELFAGCVRLTRALGNAGLATSLPVDLALGSWHDLSRESTQQAILSLIRDRWLWYVHLGTPCGIWSQARTRVKYLGRAAAKERLGISFALSTFTVCTLMRRMDGLYNVENPRSSNLWSFKPFEILRSQPGTFTVDLLVCAFGSPHQKRTRLLSNFGALRRLARTCPGRSASHVHVWLALSTRARREGRCPVAVGHGAGGPVSSTPLSCLGRGGAGRSPTWSRRVRPSGPGSAARAPRDSGLHQRPPGATACCGLPTPSSRRRALRAAPRAVARQCSSPPGPSCSARGARRLCRCCGGRPRLTHNQRFP